MTVDLLFLFLDYSGVTVFAFSGGMLAARKELDPFGAAILGAVTGMGGGTLRDVLLGELPVYWVDAPDYLWLALIGALIGYYTSPWAQSLATRRAALAWADAIGMSVFCVLGAKAGLAAGAHWSIALLTGVMSAAFGGLIRDIIVNDVPLVLAPMYWPLRSASVPELLRWARRCWPLSSAAAPSSSTGRCLRSVRWVRSESPPPLARSK